jgi:hypothetical protein
VSFMCESGIFLGGLLQIYQDTRINRGITSISRVKTRKRHIIFNLWFVRTGAHGKCWWFQSPELRARGSSGNSRNGERRSRGTSRSAHRGGRRTGAAGFRRGAAGGRLGSMMQATAFRVASGEVKMLHMSSLSSHSS